MNKFYYALLLFLYVSINSIAQQNYSLLFDGQDDYIKIPFVDHHDLFEDFSIEVWLKFDTIPDGKVLSKVGWYDPGDSVSSYSIYFDETEPYRVIFSTWIDQFPNVEHKAISTLPLTSKQWHHITVTYAEANYTKKIYIDGVLAFSEGNTGDIGYNGRPLFIGAFKTNLGDIILPFKGNIDEIRIWQKELTPSDILFNMNNQVIGNEEYLVGLWHFNEGTGDTIYDSSPYNVSGVVNDALWSQGFINGGSYVATTLTTNVSMGSTILEVDSTSGFSLGDFIIINIGGENEEINSILGLGSILLQSPLQFDHLAGELIVKFTPTSIKLDQETSNEYLLFQNYPNPFNPFTKIILTIPKSEMVQIKVYDILGKEIIKLLNEYKQAGSYEIDFDASNLPSGIYFYRMISGSYAETKKMILLR